MRLTVVLAVVVVLAVHDGARGQPAAIALDPRDVVSDDETTDAFRRFERR